MPTKTPTATYRSLLSEAWRLTKERKGLWVFGIFAGLVSTGGVVESTIRTFRTVETGREIFVSALYGSVPGLEMAGRAIHTAAALGPKRVTVAISASLIALVLLVGLALLSQAALVVGVEKQTPATLKELRTRSRGHALQILGINVLTKGATLILLVLTALPLTLFTLRGTALDAVLFLAIFLVLIPTSVAIATIGMLSLFSIVRDGRHALDAFHHALTLYRAHWLACLEYGLTLFALSLFATLALFLALLVAVIPCALLVFGAIITRLPLLYLAANLFGSVVFFVLLFLGFGAIVTFQYAAWSLFYDRLLLKGIAKLKAKVIRLWAKR